MENQHPPLAIVGIGCKFPGVDDVSTYWDLLINARSGISEVPPDRWNGAKFYHPNSEISSRMVSKWGGFIANPAQFDAHFFGIAPREARQMDPQQRWLLETSWEALEDAGIPPKSWRGADVGVFIGISSRDYSDVQQGDVALLDVHTNSSNAASIAANRISYCFDFKGPSMAVDTACSSALVAVHLACQSIWSGQAGMSLAGGVNALFNPYLSIAFSKAGMLSPSGQCFAFDHRANGYVRSEGVGVVVIEPLDQALTQGHRIYALIRAAVVNQDGHTSSLTVPGLSAQEDLLHRAYQAAGVAPGQVAYVEAHGTGTPVGDPIEAHALGQVLSVDRPENEVCLIGSVKTNIGHLESASGIAGLIKAALVLHHQVIPPNLNFEKPNPHISLSELGLQVVTATQPLPSNLGHAPIVGVNSFGFGGANAHVVLEQAPPNKYRPQPETKADRPYLLSLSARTEAALQASAASFYTFLGQERSSLADVAYSTGAHREHHEHRLVVIGQDTDQIRTGLQAGSGPDVVTGQPAAQPRPPIFAFCGQGAQWWGMGQQLLAREPFFQQTIQQIDALWQPLAGWSLSQEMTRSAADSRIDRTDIAQPALFALQVGLADLWQAWGIRPAQVIGHSVGEVAAAYVAGIYSLEDAVTIIYHRSRLQNTTGGQGSMAAVGLSVAEALAAINGYGGYVEVAAINSPHLVTLAGDVAPLNEVIKHLEAAGKFVRPLPINYAFHTYQMDPIEAELLAALAAIRPNPGSIPFVSTVTGEVMAGQALDAGYWWRNVRQPVRFAQAVTHLIQTGEDIFLEIGPHPALQNSIHDCLVEQKQAGHIFHSLRREADESRELLGNVAALHIYGLEINWARLNQSSRFVRLPAYPWQRESFWLESELRRRDQLEPWAHPLLGKRLPAPQPTWELQLDLRILAYLNDHRIWNSLIFPAAGYGEMGLAVARLLFPDEAYVVEDVQIKKALFGAEHEPTPVRVIFDESDKTFSIYSLTGQKKEWNLHVLGYLRKLVGTAPAPLDVAGLQKTLSWTDKPSFYQACSNLGFQFGPNFQRIQNIWRGPGRALAEVSVELVTVEEMADYHFHPLLLDACFQTVIGAGLAVEERPTPDLLYLPAVIGRICLFGPQFPAKLWLQATLLRHDEESILADIHVYAANGDPLAEILGSRFDRVKQSSGRRSIEDIFYQFRWQAQPLPDVPAEGVVASEDVATSYLLFADGGGITQALAEALAQTGARVVQVQAGTTFSNPAENLYTVNPAFEADLTRLLAAIQGPLRLVHAWSLDGVPGSRLSTQTLAAAQQSGVLHALRLAHALAATKLAHPPRIFFLSRDMQAVTPGDGCAGLAYAPLIGFLRVANNEFPAFKWTLLDLDAARPETEIVAVLNELTQADGELEIAYRADCRYVNRLQPIRPDDLPPLQHNAISPEGDPRPYRLQIGQAGRLSHLNLNETRRRPPEAGEVEVRVRAGGINFRDVMKVLGLYPGKPVDLTWLGDDFAGTVVEVGAGVSDLKPGDAVVGMAAYSFQSYITVKRQSLIKMPTHLSFEEAATLPTAFLTAHYAINDLARMKKGESILIHAGAGGVGQAAIQIAQALGLEIFVTAGTPQKQAWLKAQGLRHIFSSRSLDFADEVLRLTHGRGVDAILNSLAGDFIPKNFAVLAPFGRYLEIGKVDVYNNSKIGLEALRHNISVFIIDLAQLAEQKPAEIAAMLETLRRKFERRVYRPLPRTVFPISQAVEAFRYMAAGKHIGKNVLSFEVAELMVNAVTQTGQLFRPDATYLITGGASGFGLEVAQWLANQGARHLVLMSRSGPRDETAQARIEKLRAAGVKVVDARGDVTLQADVERVIRDIEAGSAPLAGVIHAAMALHDELLVDLAEEGFNRALQPKMIGAWNLHMATRALPLEHFICFSSISSIVGAVKQANYNAGNAFLEALAHYRRAMNLPALTINWGVMADAGFVARHEKTARYLDLVGIKGLASAEALQALSRILPGDGIHLAIAPVEWPTLVKYLPGLANSKLLDSLIQLETEQGAGNSIKAKIMAAEPGQRLALIEKLIGQAVAEILGSPLEQLSFTTLLTSFGLDSLMAVELLNTLNAQLGLDLPVSDVLNGATIQGVAALVLEKLLMDAAPDPSRAKSGENGSAPASLNLNVDLSAEARLDSAIYPEKEFSPASTPAQAIFLTGATGFLGAFLLADLLRHTQADIYCLVRSADAAEALQRLRRHLQHYRVWDEALSARIIPVAGDLAQADLGLPAKLFESLARQIDLIYHNGAWLNLIQPYPVLKATNVLGTQEVLRLAVQAKTKPLHYISTIAVFFSAQNLPASTVYETDLPEPQNLSGGYIQSKWVAEQLIRQAQERGLPASIYRPGLITGHSQTGVTNTLDLTSRFIKGCYQLGMWPERNIKVNLVPVDYVSRAIVYLSQQAQTLGQVFHLTNPQTGQLNAIINRAESLEYHLAEVSYPQWRAALFRQAEQGAENALHPLLSLFPTHQPDEIQQQVDCQNTLRYLADTGLVCPTVDAALLETYARYLLETGFIEPPGPQGG